MKLITRDTDYAIRALCFIAKKKGEIISATELVKKIRIPRPFLRKILQTLTRKGMLKSYKGKGGGFVIARKPEKIFITDLVRIFQGSVKLNMCMLRKSICPHIKTCAMKKKLDAIEKHVISELKATTIAFLLL